MPGGAFLQLTELDGIAFLGILGRQGWQSRRLPHPPLPEGPQLLQPVFLLDDLPVDVPEMIHSFLIHWFVFHIFPFPSISSYAGGVSGLFFQGFSPAFGTE